MLEELRGAMLEADDLTAVRCIVLQGAGKDFSAGASIGGDGPPPTYDPAEYRNYDSLADDIWRTTLRSDTRPAIFKINKPVITKIHAQCLATPHDAAQNYTFPTPDPNTNQ